MLARNDPGLLGKTDPPHRARRREDLDGIATVGSRWRSPPVAVFRGRAEHSDFAGRIASVGAVLTMS